MAAMRHEEVLDRFPDTIGALASDLDVGLGQDQHELLAAEAARHVATTHGALQQTTEVAQQGVADVVTERIVELLEEVEVDHHDAERAAAAFGAAELALEGLFQIATVEEAGQRIADRLIAQRLAELEIRDGEAELIGHGGGEPLLRLGPLRRVRGGPEIKDAERFTLRDEGDAEVRRRHRLRQVAAEKPGRRGVHEMHPAAPERPALLGLEDRPVRRRRGRPCRAGFDHVP